MPKLVVASVQQQMRLFDALDEYRKELNRFLYLARAKGAKLVVFPALTGLMAAAPRVEGFRMNLLRRADERNRRQKTLWTRTRGALAGSTAGLLKVSFRKAYEELAEADPGALADGYQAVFSELAHAYGITIVAGSCYVPAGDGTLRHEAMVFGPDGSLFGRHDKLLLGPEDEDLAEPGEQWTPLDTPVGRLGLLFGEEALYPEAGRVLAYQGAELLVILGATTDDVTASYIRQAALARAQENQCFALTSFLVGKNYLAPGVRDTGEFLGKSGIYAPLEMTPRNSGVLVEMGTNTSEGLLTAELDPDGLREIWRTGRQRLRSRMPVQVFASYLPPVYASRRTLAEIASSASVAPPLGQPPGLAAPSELMLPPAELAPLMAEEEVPTSVDVGGDEPEMTPRQPDEEDLAGESTGEPGEQGLAGESVGEPEDERRADTGDV